MIVDIENIKISTALETEIIKIFPGEEIIKIAVGNWRLLKLDLELRERGYQLFHVPTGRDNADLEIINLGWLLKSHTKLVIVSNDKIFLQFVHQFNSYGKKAYLVYHSKTQAGFVILNPQILLHDNPKIVSKQSTIDSQPKPDIVATKHLELNTLNVNYSLQFTSSSQFTQALQKIISQKRTIVTPEALAGEFYKQFGIKASTALTQCKIHDSFNKFVIDNGIIISSNPKEELTMNIRKMLLAHPQLALDLAKMGQEFKKLYGISISEKMKEVGILGKCTKFIAQIHQDLKSSLN